MGTFSGWLFFSAVVGLFSWGLWMGLMGIMAPLDHTVSNDTDMPNGTDAMVYYNPEAQDIAQWQAA